MSDLQLVLLVLAGVCLVAQLVVVGIGIAYAARGRRVNLGLGWTLIAGALLITVVLL